MAVKRVGSKAARPRRGRKSSAPLALPTEVSGPEEDIRKYITLIYGQTGVGKSTLAASYPGAVFLATEAGTKGLEVFEFNAEEGGITDWRLFRAAVDALVEDGGETYTTVVIDTVDRAYEHCMRWVEKELGIAHVSEDPSGKRDRSGKGWTTLKQEFTKQLYRLVEAGYGIVMTSHAKTASIESSSGTEYDLIVPSMSGQALGVIKSITDCIFYAEFVKDIRGEGGTRRILVTEGDELILAKARGDEWPKYLPLRKQNGYEIIAQAFAGEHPGIPASEIVLSKQTAESAAQQVKVDRAKEKGGGGSSKKKSTKKKVSKKKKKKKETS